jgi:GDPmannose 4,6-dehydratase
VVATGEQFSVRTFVEWAFEHVQIKLRWEGSGVDEVGIDAETGKVLVRVNPRYFRPAEVETLLGDSTKAREILGWKPKKTTRDLLMEMMECDLLEANRQKHLKDGGFSITKDSE